VMSRRSGLGIETVGRRRRLRPVRFSFATMAYVCDLLDTASNSFWGTPGVRAGGYPPAASTRTVRIDLPTRRGFDSALEGLREHVTRELLQLTESLAAAGQCDLTRAKQAIAKHVGKLVLTPATRDGRPVYKVTGSITVPADGGGEECRMQLVARDGIEPPTAAFSGLR
jgi:hypothetical protein